jgi:hypothetical protein
MRCRSSPRVLVGSGGTTEFTRRKRRDTGRQHVPRPEAGSEMTHAPGCMCGSAQRASPDEATLILVLPRQSALCLSYSAARHFGGHSLCVSPFFFVASSDRASADTRFGLALHRRVASIHNLPWRHSSLGSRSCGTSTSHRQESMCPSLVQRPPWSRRLNGPSTKCWQT